jgi:hypothetical protein
MTEDEKKDIVTVYQETIKRFLILRLNIEVRDDGVCFRLPRFNGHPVGFLSTQSTKPE